VWTVEGYSRSDESFVEEHGLKTWTMKRLRKFLGSET
jgi:hypothetical protein